AVDGGGAAWTRHGEDSAPRRRWLHMQVVVGDDTGFPRTGKVAGAKHRVQPAVGHWRRTAGQSMRSMPFAVVSSVHPEVARAHLRRGPPVASKRATPVPLQQGRTRPACALFV